MTAQHPARATLDKNTLARQEKFLASFPDYGSVAETCRAVGITAECHRLWLKGDVQGYVARWAVTQEEYGGFLEHLAHKRVLDPDKDTRTGSDILLIAMLNANKPDKYHRGEQRTPSGPVMVTSITINMPDGVKTPLPTPTITEADYKELPSRKESDPTESIPDNTPP